MKNKYLIVAPACAALVLGVATSFSQEQKQVEAAVEPAPAAAAEDVPADGVKPVEDAADKPAGEGLLPALDPDGKPLTEPVEGLPAPPSGPAPKVDRNYVVTRTSPDQGFLEIPLSGITVYKDYRKSVKEKQGALPERGAGVFLIDGLATPEPEVLRNKLQGQLGKKATFSDLEKIVDIILDHYKTRNRPMTHVYIPQQPYGGNMRFAVIEGTVGNAYVITEAELRSKAPASMTPREANFAKRIDEGSWWDSWYRDPYEADDLKRKLEPRLDRIRGRILDTDELKVQMAAINRSPWARLNRPVEHPFREVDVVFSPPASDVLGQTDLVFEVRDSRPLKFFAGAENNLTELLGENRFFIGGAWYDAFALGLDHQLGAQVFSATDPGELVGVSGSYIVPWAGGEQFTELFAAFADSTAEVDIAGVPSEIGGTNLLLGGRHYYELPEMFGASDFSEPLGETRRMKGWADVRREAVGLHHEVGAGFDFKSSDNDVFFGGSNVASNPADILQFVVEYNARQTDPIGETNFAWQTFFSPGDLIGNNDDESFEALRFDSSATYIYTKIKLDREQDLPYGMMARAVLTGQWSDGNLQASEQLGIGGFDSVRGYKERIHRGDYGVVFNLELFSPVFRPSRDWFKLKHDDTLRFLTFMDIGYGAPVEDDPNDVLDDDQTLMSVGAGIRYEYDDNFRLRLDYGVQLEDPKAAANTEDGGAFHFGAVVTF
jgi:hemolysin activation/secretion protein